MLHRSPCLFSSLTVIDQPLSSASQGSLFPGPMEGAIEAISGLNCFGMAGRCAIDHGGSPSQYSPAQGFFLGSSLAMGRTRFRSVLA